jgi:hypothetical protein
MGRSIIGSEPAGEKMWFTGRTQQSEHWQYQPMTANRLIEEADIWS